ncbi:MAG: amidohydrolase family protein [Acidobacteriota bacterium]
MKLDIFNHLFPQKFFDTYIAGPKGLPDIGKRVAAMPTIVNLDARFKVMDEFGDYQQVISLPAPPIEAMGTPAETPAIAQLANDGMAELVRKHPDRFPTFVASLPMNNPDAILQEALRAVDHLGAAGVQIFTNVNGKALDAPEFAPFFDEMARREIGIWMHPTRGADFSDYQAEDRSQYEIWWTFGWPYETSAAMARMVFSGFFDKRPNLKLLTHHMGAMIPFFEGRVGYGWDALGSRTSNVDYVSLLKSMKKRPIDYFKMFHADTALFGALAGTKCGLDFFGVDKVLFASDVPFEPAPGLYIRETIRVIEALDLPADQKEQIYRGNAEKFLKHR